MKLPTVIFILTFFINCLGQDTAYVHIKPETDYPSDRFSENAKSNRKWIINSTEVKYEEGKYSIPLSNKGEFDTVEVQTIHKGVSHYELRNFRKPKPIKSIDTLSTQVLCKFRDQHNYSLSQIYPGSFNIFSLDTFNINQKIKVEINDFENNDTLFLSINYNIYEIYSDTVVNYFDANNEMKNDLIVNIQLSNYKDLLIEDYVTTNDIVSIFDFNFLFVHGEELLIETNIASGKTNLKLR